MDLTLNDDSTAQGDCNLNTPRCLPGKPPFVAGQKVRFHYRLGADPGLDYAVLPG